MKHRSTRPPQSKSCSGKNRYTREAAEDMAQYRASQYGSLMDAYRCQYGCTLDNGSPAWHIGHRIANKRGPQKRTR